MNDRFKFRIYDKGNEQYLDPEDMDCVCHLPNGCFTIATWDGIQGDMKYWADEDIVVEMSTGLKDKNGNLIYEGDIILLRNNKFEVGHNNITVFFKCITDKYVHIDPTDFDYDDSEIIGNIHKQPEQGRIK